MQALSSVTMSPFIDISQNNNSQQPPSVSDNIIVENNPIIQKAKEAPARNLQGIIKQLHQLARFPKSVNPEQIALLPSQLNEALQKEPCFLLEHYQVRILQLQQMLSDAEQLLSAEPLCSALKQHLIHVERAAETLFQDSTIPVQDSLWPLYKRILRLPTLEPDFFGAAIATLHEKLHDAISFNPLIQELQTLLTELRPPAHYLWQQAAPYTSAIQKLEEIKQKCLILVHRLKKAPDGYVKTFCAPIESILETYRSFLEEFSKASDKKKHKMSLPKAQVTGPGLGFFSLHQGVARPLVSRDERGTLCKKNALGAHATHCEAGIFYKCDSDNTTTCIPPEMEFAIYALHQRLGQKGVTPTALIKISNLFFEGRPDPQGHILQVSDGIDDGQSLNSETPAKTMLYLLTELMDSPVDQSVAQQLSKATPEGLVFDWLVALEEQNQRYIRLEKQAVLTLEDGASPLLPVPLKVDTDLIPMLFEKLLSRFGKGPNSPENEPVISVSPKQTVAEAALMFLQSIDLSSLSLEQRVSLTGQALRTFPSPSHLLALPGDPASPLSRADFFLMAVQQGHCALVTRLLEEEKISHPQAVQKRLSLIEMKDHTEQTPLLIACCQLNLEMIRLLIRYGANLQAYDTDGHTALSLCLMRLPQFPEKASTAARLLADQKGIFFNLHHLINVASEVPETAEPLMTYLIERGANPDLVDGSRKTPLDHAMERGLEPLVKQLIYLGAGRTLNVQATQAFFCNRPHLTETLSYLKSQSSLLRWHLALDALRAASSPSKGTLEGTLLGEIQLPPDVLQELIDKQGDICSQIEYGRRNVAKITLSGGHELFFKQYPEMPGIEYAIDTLFELLIGHGTCLTDLAKLTPPNAKSYPVLISQGIQGENFHDVLKDSEKAKQLDLDPLYFSELLLASLLVNFEDAKPDNFILEPLPGGNYRLVGIDNDHAFVPPLVKEGGKTVQVKCILYCLDQMKHPLHPSARDRFLSFTPEGLLKLWLCRLQEKNQRYCLLFSEKERRELFKKSKKHEGMIIPIALKPPKLGKLDKPIEPGVIVDIYQKFQRLQIALQESPQLTGMQVLRLVIPSLGMRYEEAFQSHDTPLERFESLTKTQYSKTTAGCRETLKLMGIPKHAAWKEAVEQGPTLALKELENLENETQATDEQLLQIRDALQAGNVDAFNKLQLDITREKIINGVPDSFEGIDFKTMSLEKQRTVLFAILGGNYRSLRLCGCAALDRAAFTQLLRSSPQLLSLELRDCSKVDQGFLTQLSELGYLANLRLSDLIQLEKISIPHPTLRQLEFSHCQGLQQLTISHTLKSLSIEECGHLFTINARPYQRASRLRAPRLKKEALDTFVLQTLQLKACPNLKPWSQMFESLLKESPTHQIQLQNAPLNPNQKDPQQVIKAVLHQSKPKEMLKSLENCYQGRKIGKLITLINDCQDNPLTELNLSDYADELTDGWLEALVTSYPDLTSVVLTLCYRITDSGVKALAKGCPNLTSLNLNYCNQITDLGLKRLAKSCPNLTTVHLNSCDKITDLGLKQLTKSHPNLTTVDVGGNNQITNLGLKELARHCPNLTCVVLGGYEQITDTGVQALAKHCKNLRIVFLDDCKQITNLGLEMLAKGCPQLTKVSLLNCDTITSAGREAVQMEFPNIVIYDN